MNVTPARASFGALALLLVMTIFSGLFSVAERERAVVTRNGAFSYVAGPGLHVKLPFIDTVAAVIPVDTVNTLVLEKLETFTTGDQPQHVDLWVTVQWSIPAGNAERYFRLGSAVTPLLSSMVIDRAKKEVGTRHANAIPVERGAIVTSLLEQVRTEAARLYGVTIIDLQLVNYDYSPAFRAAVDNAATAGQRQAQVRADAQSAEEKAKGEANAAIQAARGQADSRLTVARSEAEAIRLRGDAEASAIEAQAKALGSNPNLVNLRQAERWNGALPTHFVPGSALPFLNLAPAR